MLRHRHRRSRSSPRTERRLSLERLEPRALFSQTPLGPTTSGIPDVYVTENAAPYTVALQNDFSEPGVGYGGLSYQVLGDTNPALFSSTSLDGYGDLVLNFAANAYGNACLTVQATDSGRQSAQSSFNVNVLTPPYVSSGIPNVQVNENAAPYRVSLQNYFGDAEAGYGG